MTTTEKRITLALTKEDIRELEILSEFFGKNQSKIIKRSLILESLLI
jgi:hypothetical protein